MKQSGILLFYGIALVNIALSTAVDCTNGDLAITKITANDVAISWDKTCFNEATSYIVTMNVTDNGDCSFSVPCVGEGNLCTTSIQEMGSSCTKLVRPCREVTMDISGGGNFSSITTKLAPLLSETDWQLEEKSKIVEGNLDVIWGPPKDSSNPYVSCATNAKVTVTCLGVSDINVEKLDPQDATITDIAKEAKVTFNLKSCGPGLITPTVTYMAGDVPTETKKSVNRNYIPLGWIKCYECDSNNSTNCNDLFNKLEELESQATYKSCAKKDGDGDKAERYGLRVSGQDGGCETNSDSCYYCNTDLCNGAPNYTAPMTLITIVTYIIQSLLY